MISIALCDNEVSFLDFYEEKIKSYAKKYNLLLETIRFASGESLLFYLNDHPNKFQLIYLDIMMGKLNGIETALEIRKFNPYAKIIFLTSTESFVYTAFDAHATHYLLKNIHDNKFETVLHSTLKQIESEQSKDLFKIKQQQDEIIVAFNQICYFESFKRQILTHLSDKRIIEFYYKLSDLTSELVSKSFILVHRSYLVNLQYIQKITKSEIVLKTGQILPVSRDLYLKVKTEYMNYLNGLIQS